MTTIPQSPVRAGQRERVRFDVGNTFIAGDLHLPADYDPRQRYRAVAIGGSLSSVKEQMSGRYARELAARGFVALAIDYRNYGESGGPARQYEHPDLKAEDLSAAVSYLASRDDVQPDGYAVLGICTSGGNVFYAAARDPNIAAVACVAGHLVEPQMIASLPVYGGTATIERHRAEGREARAAYERTGEVRTITCYHASDLAAAFVGPLVYYLDESRGLIPEWRNELAVMSWEPWLEFNPVREAERVTAPTLIVYSDGCVTPEQARKVYAKLRGPKTLHWTDGEHFDFYDGRKVGEAADAIAEHFREHLA
jgi:fermentation-respiration switch protein FrsA (DUF1100 family)